MSSGPKMVLERDPGTRGERRAWIRELHELFRVSCWDLVFQVNEPKRNFPIEQNFPSLLLRSTGAIAPRKLLEAHPDFYTLDMTCRESVEKVWCATQIPGKRGGGGGMSKSQTKFARSQQSPSTHLISQALHAIRCLLVGADKEGGVCLVYESSYLASLDAVVRGGPSSGYTFIANYLDIEWGPEWVRRELDILNVVVPFLRANVGGAGAGLDFVDHFARQAFPPPLGANYVDRSIKRLPQLYLLVKTHKFDVDVLINPGSPFPARPICSASRWVTTYPSFLILCAFNYIEGMDRAIHPNQSPLRSSLDMKNRLQHSSHPSATLVDFDGLYPHLLLHHALEGAYWWCDRLSNSDDAFPLPAEEQWQEDLFTAMCCPGPDMFFQNCAWGESAVPAYPYFLMSLCYILFSNMVLWIPTKGVYQQTSLPMGVSCAVQLSNMILRSWELRAMERGLWPARWGLLRYLDDVTVLHANGEGRQVLQTLKDIYPPDLPFSPEAVGVSSFTALDLWVVCLSPLRTAVWFKPTNRAIYIPLEACVPWHIKAGFIKTESIRYLRLASEQIFYQCAVDRLCSRLISIGYTMPFISKQIVSWTDRDIYLQPRAKRPRTGERVHALRYQFSGFQRIDPLMVKNAWRSLAPRSLSQTRLFTVPLGGVNILAQCHAALWNRLKVIAGLKPRVNGFHDEHVCGLYSL